MLTVKTPEEALAMLKGAFPPWEKVETVPLKEACGRVLHRAVVGWEYVPGFDRSTVDGYAVQSADTFGCSDALPAMLALDGEIAMGEGARRPLRPGACVAVPTGGAVPQGADAVVMLEYVEDYGDGTVGIGKAAAPGMNLIFRGDDVSPGKEVLPAGRRLTPQDIGALAALGVAEVTVRGKPLVGILSTGNELVPVAETPAEGQVRDVNSALLRAVVERSGAQAKNYGIIPDEETLLKKSVDLALQECDVVLISGGSSVGMKDATCRVVEEKGQVLLHGIAMKPGKPTIVGKVGDKPVMGLPGHPVAAFFVAQIFVRALLAQMSGRVMRPYTLPAILTEAVSANHGRAQYTGVFLTQKDSLWYASPIRSKSGLITTLAGSDGYFCIPRDCEGVAAGETVAVTLYAVD